MAYYIEDELTGPALGKRRPTVNDYFLSSYTLSIYDGCEFGCPYCDGWAYRMRPFNETVRVAVNLVDKVAEELEQISRDDVVAITALTDPYQPAEATYRMTRQVLRLFAERGQPCVILTKSPAVLEDLVLLEQINGKSLAVVMFTIVAVIPVMPYVNDTDYMISSTVRAVADAGADFMVWEYLHIPSERHRSRINEMLTRIGSYPPSYYRDLYGQGAQATPLPSAVYRTERDREILLRCDAQNLPIRAPHHLFAGKINPRSEASLLLKHTAARDAIQGRAQLAAQGRDLADLVFQEQATDAQLRQSPLYPQLAEILAGL